MTRGFVNHISNWLNLKKLPDNQRQPLQLNDIRTIHTLSVFTCTQGNKIPASVLFHKMHMDAVAGLEWAQSGPSVAELPSPESLFVSRPGSMWAASWPIPSARVLRFTQFHWPGSRSFTNDRWWPSTSKYYWSDAETLQGLWFWKNSVF